MDVIVKCTMTNTVSAYDALLEEPSEHLDATEFEIELDNGVMAETFISIGPNMITVAGRVWLDGCGTLSEYNDALREVQGKNSLPEKEQFVDETNGISTGDDASETGKWILLHGEQRLVDENGDVAIRPDRADVYQCYYVSEDMESVEDIENALENISGVEDCSITIP